MNPIISIMAQGGMGAATASRLVQKGLQVRTDLTGRSAASAERAAKAGMKPVREEELAGVDFFLSIVPPADAVALANRLSPALARAARKPIYVDFNAVNPQTTENVARIVQATGARFVDGAIIGGPPRADRDGPAYYVSGADGKLVEALAAFGLKIVVLDAPIGAASALKMSYAGITKGLTAISCSMILAAQRAGVSDALYNRTASPLYKRTRQASSRLRRERADAIKEAPAYWAGALSLGEETPKEGKREIAHFNRWRNYAYG
jgi:L-threonate 2-dehydrogenase